MAVKGSDQISIVDITDAYTVGLTSEAYTFIGDTSAAKAGTCSTQVIAYCGSEAVLVTVGSITCPTGITASITNNGTATPTITFTAAAGKVTSACEATIPLTVDGDISFTKKFSFGVALTGATGAKGSNITISSQSVTYQASSSGTTAPTGTWSTAVPTISNGQYLWTKTYVKYSDGTETTAYSVSYKGTNGTNGADGADAITISVTSSNGTIFKNADIATVLTAHVYKAGKELTSSEISALGTVKWYKDGATTAAATGTTLTISAGDVSNKATYVAQLEG